MLQQLETIKQTLLGPISEAEPCGEDPKYEDAYETIKQEIAKMGGMGVGATDWEKVAGEAHTLLETRSKELNLASYLAVAWTVNHGLEGMVAGLELVKGLIETYWENMFPPLKRIKPRKSAFIWLQDRIADRLPQCESKDRALLERASAAIGQLKDSVYERFDEPPCNFRKLRDTLEEWMARAPEPKPMNETLPETAPPPSDLPAEQSRVGPAPAPAPPVTAPPRPAVPVEVPSPAEDADAEQLLEVLAKIAGQLRTLALHRDVSYRLQRIAIWEGAVQPGSNEARETFFPAPPEEVANALKNMFAKAVWDQLLERAEDLTNRWWYWLDLQYYASSAAAQLQYEEVRDAVDRETFLLDERMPGLKELKFNDGTPFASVETRDWLSGLSSRADGGGGEAEQDSAADLRSDMRGFGTEKFAEAMHEAQAAVDRANNRRDTLRLRLEAASFCMEVDQAEWAVSLLAGLVEEMEQHDLAYWEPQLAARVWRLMLEVALRLKEQDTTYRDWERRAMRALAIYDLTQAGHFPKKKEPFS